MDTKMNQGTGICLLGRPVVWLGALAIGIAGCGGCKSDSKEKSQLSARDVMVKTFDAYRAADRYSDRAALYLTEIQGEKELERPAIPFSLSLARPNQMQLILGLPPHEGGILGESIVVSDGTRMRVVTTAQEEILDVEAPATLTTKNIRKAIDDSVIGRCQFPTARLEMLIGSGDADEVISPLDKAEFLEPGKISESEYWRVSIPTALGPRVYWIDQENFVLRRVEISKDEIDKAFASLVPFKVGSARIDYVDAQFEAESDIKRYQLETRDAAILVSDWLPKEPEPLPEMLGKVATDFSFTDLDGEPVTDKELADKVVVMDFWATWCKPCLESMPKLSILAEKYKDNPRVRFMAINIEGPKRCERLTAFRLRQHRCQVANLSRPRELQQSGVRRDRTAYDVHSRRKGDRSIFCEWCRPGPGREDWLSN